MNHLHDLSEHVVFTTRNISSWIKKLKNLPPPDIAAFIETRFPDERQMIFNALPTEISIKVFQYFSSSKIQQEILAGLPSQQMADVLNGLPPDDRTALLAQLPTPLVNQLLKYLSPEEKALSIQLLGYPANSVGRLMTPDYLAVKMDWTVKKVLGYIRKEGRDSETINVIYAIDDQGVLLDDFRIRAFFLAPLQAQVKDLADYHFIALNVDDDEEKAVSIFRKYGRVALPVVDDTNHLLGIVTIDDVMDLALKEDTEDIQKSGGVEALQEPYMQVTFFTLMQKRVGWLVLLFLGEMFTATAMGYFQDEIAKAVVLALFIPLIVSSGGNAGSQASALVIRALALGEVRLSDWWRVMRRELCAGLFLGTALGLIGFFRVTLWSAISNIYGAHWFLIALTVFFALIGVVLWGTLSGAMLPLVLKKLGFDPAVSSAPFVATLVDVVGVIIYFTIALVILRGALL